MSSGQGVVVGSITYDGSIGEYSLIVVPVAFGSAPLISVGYTLWPPLGPLYDDGLKARGNTFAVALPAGEYKIIGWQIRQGYKTSRSTRPIDAGFVVEAGKASYLGNLHFDEEWQVSLRDRSPRDLPVMQARYPFMKTTPLAYGIAAGADVRGLGGDYASSVQPPPMLFLPIKR